MVWGFVYSPSAATGKVVTPGFLDSLLGSFNPAVTTLGRRPAEAKGHYVGTDGYAKADANYGAEFLQFFYDKNGFEGLILYKDRLGNPKQGLDRAFGKLNHWNSKGHNLYQISIDVDGNPMTDDSGNCGALSYYDAHGNLTFSASFNKEGNLVDWKDRGFAARAYGRDRSGNNVSLSYYNADGTRGLSEDGYYRVEKTFDDRGYVVEYRYFGKNEEPVLLNEGYHIWRGLYDKDGNLAEFSYFDAKALPTSSTSGFHKAVSSYDESGRQTQIAYFDTAGNKTLHKDGYHIAATQFEDKRDSKGWTTQRWSYYGTGGKPIENSSTGAHATLTTIDGNGRTAEYAYFDRQSLPVASRSGYHKVKQSFDVAGNRVERRFLGVDDRPALSLDGISSELAVYNDNNNQISIEYYDADGKPGMVKDTGIHRIERTFDVMGRRTREAYFGADRKRTLNGFGAHLKTSAYDEQGNETETAFFGVTEERVVCGDGHHLRKNAYDKWRRLVSQQYFDAGRGPCVDSGSLAHQVSYQYDPRGRRVEISYFGEKDRRVLGKDRYHLRRIEYDDHGNVVGTRVFGTKSERIAPVEFGCHYKKATFDERNRQLSETYFDTQDRPSYWPCTTIHRIAFTNDEFGRRVATTFFQIDGSPGSRRDGVHKFTQSYDNLGRVVKESYFDSSNNPTINADGFQSVTLRRDALGNIIEKSFFDAKGEPVTWMPDGGVHRILFRYDGSGHVIEESYFDTDRKPALGTIGVHRIVREFNGYGNITEISFFDKWGVPAAGFGKHRIVSLYRNGQLVSESSFDANGQPVVRNGISGRGKRSDKIEMLDQNGNPTPTLGVITVGSVPIPGGRGEAAGVQLGDIILAYKDWRFPFERDVVDWNRAFDGLIAATSAQGEGPRKLTVLRDGRLTELSIAPGTLQLRLTNEASSTSWLRTAAAELK